MTFREILNVKRRWIDVATPLSKECGLRDVKICKDAL